MEVGVRAQSVTVRTASGLTFVLAEGAHIPVITGEAYVYVAQASDGKQYAVKVYHGLNPLYDYKSEFVTAVQRRLRRYPVKLNEYPVVLPLNVMRSLGVVYDTIGQPVGYYMSYIDNCRKLSDLLKISTRKKEDIDPNFIMLVMRNVHRLVEGVHAAGAIICDLKPSNILVRMTDGEVFLIDTDSMRFGSYLSTAHTLGYADPRQFRKQKDGRHDQFHMLPSQRTDWYAFAVMTCVAFLQAMPYEAVATRKKPDGSPYTAAERCEERITLLAKGDVIYPPLATPRNRVPLYVLNFVSHVFERDGRGECPIALFNVQWSKCTNKTQEGVEHGWHARTVCPECADAPTRRSMSNRESVAYNRCIAQSVSVLQEYTVAGNIVAADCQGGLLRLAQMRRLGVVADANGRLFTWLKPQVKRFALSGRRLGAIVGNELHIGTSASQSERLTNLFAFKQPPLAANSKYFFCYTNGRLLRAVGENDRSSSGKWGADQLALWAGEEVGFAFVRRGDKALGMVFNASGQPYIRNEIAFTMLQGRVDAVNCYFGDDRVWLLAMVRYGQQALMYMLVANNNGDVLYEEVLPAVDYTGSIVGHCAFDKRLIMGLGVHFLELECDDTGVVKPVATHRKVLPSAQPGRTILRLSGRRFFAVHDSTIIPFKL